MLRRGRVSLAPRKIKGLGAIRTILKAAETLKLPVEREPLEYEKAMVGYRAVG
jgi:hypothetical protein